MQILIKIGACVTLFVSAAGITLTMTAFHEGGSLVTTTFIAVSLLMSATLASIKLCSG